MFRAAASIVFAVAIAVLCACDDGTAVSDGPPRDFDPSARYVVVLSRDPETAKAVAARGYRVVREPVPDGEDTAAAAVAVKEHIRQMMARGLAPERLAVAGIGPGGRLALEVASLMHLPRAAYVLVGACPSDAAKAENFGRLYAATLKGRILSLVPSGGAGSCSAVFDASRGVEWWEAELPAQPAGAWLDQLDAWVKATPAS